MVKDLKQEHWDTIIFTDEKTLQNYHNGKIKVYRKRGNGKARKFIYRKTLNRFKLNLFGYITSNGVGNLYVFSDKTDSELYINYLHHCILPDVIEQVGPNFIWLQDNAPFHSSNLTLEYLKSINLNLLIYPPASPELNIIERVWSRLQKEVNDIILEEGLPKNKEELIEYAYRSWYSISDDYIRSLYKSLSVSVRKVLLENAIETPKCKQLKFSSNFVLCIISLLFIRLV